MKYYEFPSISIDNFFDNPDKVRSFALEQNFYASNDPEWKNYTDYDNVGKWPGKRTQHLAFLNNQAYNLICAKLFSIFYDHDPNIKWEVQMHFQHSNPYFEDDELNRGWIHKDNGCLFAGLVYLTPDIDPDAGTTLWDSKDDNFEFSFNNVKKELYSGNKVNQEICKKSLDCLYSNYEKKLEFKNKYNTLVAYSGNQYHCLSKMAKNRLTLVFFVTKLDNAKMPNERSSFFKV